MLSLRPCLLLFLPLLLLLPHTAAVGADDDVGCPGARLQNVGGDSIVCVCGSKGCPPLGTPAATTTTATTATTITTSQRGDRFKEGKAKVVRADDDDDDEAASSEEFEAVVEIAVEAPKQVMNGFGGAMTDAAALTMSSLSPASLDALLRAYFSPEGLEYSLLRVPIGGCDFSLTPYTYADNPPDTLSGPSSSRTLIDRDTMKFALKEEDVKFKLPLLRRALGMGRRPPRVLASPWGAPAWMKENKKINESGQILREMWQPWADYIVKFMEEYEDAGVPIWALTTQNHAFDHNIIPWNSMFWTPETMKEWIKTSLGPALHDAGRGKVKVYVGDDNRDKINYYSRKVLNDPGAARYITGVAVHWYLDEWVGPQVLDQTHLLYPDKDILYTEACIEPRGSAHIPVILGSWARAERYAKDIIEDVNHHSSGWIDWNLCLDMSGGPNWAGNRVDAPVIINQERDEFYLQPMFFIMGHFSKFVPPGSVAVPSWVRERHPGEDPGTLHTAAFLHPEGHVVLQLLNVGDEEMEVKVEWGGGTSLHTSVPPRALQTLLLPGGSHEGHAKAKYLSPSDGYCVDETCN